MAEYQLVRLSVADIGYVKASLLRAYDAVEKHMLQDIAKLFAYLGSVVGQQGVTKLIGFLDGMGPERGVGLFPVPWTFLAEVVKDIQQTPESLQLLFTCMHIFFFVVCYSWIYPTFSRHGIAQASLVSAHLAYRKRWLLLYTVC